MQSTLHTPPPPPRLRNARSENNEKMFSRDDWLTKTQIRNFFSRLAASRRKQQWANSATSIEDDVNDDLELIESIEEQNENEEILQEVVDEISLKHPIACV